MDPNEDKIRKYLKKNIQVDVNKTNTKKENEEFVKRKLFTEQTHQSLFQKQSFFEKMKNLAFDGYGFFRTRKFRLFMRDTLPFLAFLSFSTWIIYKMELQFDKINQTVFKVKTIKEQEIERENDYISKALRGEKFSNQENQITDVPDKRNKYKFEEMEGDDFEFDTRDDFLEGLRKDYNQGMTIPDEYKDQVFDYAQRENKKIGFGIGLSADDQENDQSQGNDLFSKQPKPVQRKVNTIKRKTKKLNLQDDGDEELGYEGFGPSTSD